MTPTPHRQLLMDAIRERLSTITTGNGYSSDIGFRIFEWRDQQSEPLQDHELPACYMRDQQGSTQALDASAHEHSIVVEIGAVEKGPDCPETARRLEADIITAIGTDPTFGGLCKFCQPTDDRYEVNQGGARTAGVQMNFDVKYRLKAFNPYELHEGPQ